MTHKKRSFLPIIGINIALSCCVFVLVYASFFMDGAPKSIPETMPAFGMPGYKTETFGSADLKDSIMLVNIFASWCTPCRAEHDVLTTLSQHHNIPIYGIALKDTEEDLDKFFAELGNPYTAVGMDNAGLIHSAFKLSGVPATLVLTQDLKIHRIFQGPLSETAIQTYILPLYEDLQSYSSLH